MTHRARLRPPDAAAGGDAQITECAHRSPTTTESTAPGSARSHGAAAAGLDVTVAAPDGERSGSGAAMSGLAEGGRLLVEDRTLDGLADVRTVAVQHPRR